MYDITLQQLLIRILAVLAITAVHGLAIAAMARLLGDDGPKHDGRMTANPIAQGDLIGALAAILFSLGWIRPVAIDCKKLRGGRFGLLAVVVAAFVATLAIIPVVSLIRAPAFTTLPQTAAMTIDAWAKITTDLAAAFALFNLLPIPPLTGAHLLAAINPAWRVPEKHLTGWAVALAIVVVAFPIERWLRPYYHLFSLPFLG